ncbi:flagellar biosynthesis protein FliP [Planococcus antarcticus DSM 14505]|uniref:Flagellar biosynthetic protein FliP n=1 Tax=Planococcus antarcticus DSM 14505 TaxID=1185653 RepID=A0A1C7DCJ2_9BACL|nr:flagellar type III secretion system pore protein FliP [Planococcus antarcticus]ANU09165.1 flagellar biosynthetic protein FliP [Planococcus antarcticus DSM 14505]EIM08494.1 flagellar biosynthesis protein FliP [Planococcus antarcticus DSM 14505]
MIPEILSSINIPGIDFGGESPEDVSTTLQLFFLLTVLSLAPGILIMMTSFTRIIIVLSFVRTGLGTQSMPPNQVLVGLALFLTFFIMSPIAMEMNETALQPYLDGDMEQQEALDTAIVPLKEFMAKNTREKDLALFFKYAELEKPDSIEEIPLTSLIPAFAISEMKTAFQIGFVIFIPFLIIDMVVASTLMAMGMMMLPPVMISLPFKILLFVLVDGWYLIIESLLVSF